MPSTSPESAATGSRSACSSAFDDRPTAVEQPQPFNLNTALGAELEAVAAYQAGADSGLLQKPVLELAVTFQGHHRQHAAALAGTIRKLGGTPAEAKPSYAFPTDTLKSQADVLRFAAGLEKGAVSAYLGAVGAFGDRDLAKVAASILGDESVHWAILRNALGEVPVPAAFLS